jgi:hypothetical protein
MSAKEKRHNRYVSEKDGRLLHVLGNPPPPPSQWKAGGGEFVVCLLNKATKVANALLNRIEKIYDFDRGQTAVEECWRQ